MPLTDELLACLWVLLPGAVSHDTCTRREQRAWSVGEKAGMSRKEGQDDWRRASLLAVSDRAEIINSDEVPGGEQR